MIDYIVVNQSPCDGLHVMDARTSLHGQERNDLSVDHQINLRYMRPAALTIPFLTI